MPKAVKFCLCALNFATVHFLNMRKVIYPQIFRLLQSCVYHIAKNFLPLIQQIADLLTKIGLLGTLRFGIMQGYIINFVIADWFILSSTHEGVTVALLFFTNPHPLWCSLYSKFSGCRLTSHVNLLLVRSNQAEMMIVKRLILGRSNFTRVWV